jgi:transposase
MRLIRLPPYAPEPNPQEHVWDELREKEFPNRVYADLRNEPPRILRRLLRLKMKPS